MNQPPNRVPLPKVPSNAGGNGDGQPHERRQPSAAENAAAHYFDNYLVPLNNLTPTGRTPEAAAAEESQKYRQRFWKDYRHFLLIFAVATVVLDLFPLFASYFNLTIYTGSGEHVMRREDADIVLLILIVVKAWALPVATAVPSAGRSDKHWNWRPGFVPLLTVTYVALETVVYWVAYLIFDPPPQVALFSAWGSIPHFLISMCLFVMVFSIAVAGLGFNSMGGLGPILTGGFVALFGFLLGFGVLMAAFFLLDEVLVTDSALWVVLALAAAAVAWLAAFAVIMVRNTTTSRQRFTKMSGITSNANLDELAQLEQRAAEMFPPVPPQVMALRYNREQFIPAYAQVLSQYQQFR